MNSQCAPTQLNAHELCIQTPKVVHLHVTSAAAAMPQRQWRHARAAYRVAAL